MALTIENATDLVKAYIASAVKYTESHGDAYAHMPKESWSSTDNGRLIKFMEANELPVGDIDELADFVLDNFNMVSRHAYDRLPANVFTIAIYNIQEVELPVEPEDIHPDMTMPMLLEVLNEGRIFFTHREGDDSVFIYTTTDTSWNVEISLEELTDRKI